MLLFSKTPAILMDTVTDKEGNFVFDHIPRVDTPIFVLKAVNKHGKSFNVGIRTDDIQPPVFTKPLQPTITPWYVNSDSTLLNYTKSEALAKQQEYLTAGNHLLKEVKITAKKIVNGSQNLNGPGNADLVLDEKDLEAASKKTWLQLLQENLKGFREGFFAIGAGVTATTDRFLNLYVTDLHPDTLLPEWYFIKGKPVKLIVDGTSLNQVITMGSFRDMTDYLNHTAEDVKGIEVMSSAKYTAEYFSRYDPTLPDGTPLSIAASLHYPPVLMGPSDIAFIEITTRSGHGPIIDYTPGMYLYKPLAISTPAQFYKPRYNVTDKTTKKTDLRSTIDWEPNIITGKNGEAQVFFYTADKPSTYTITIEGADMKGNLGHTLRKITVE